MSETIARDTVIKFCNLVSDDATDPNGKFGLVRKQLVDGSYRIMQTSGRDISVKRENFEIVDIDLNKNVENGVVLIFPPSTGRTGTNVIAVPLSDFPHEVMHPGMTPYEWDFEKLLLPPKMYESPDEETCPRFINPDVLLTKKEMKKLKKYITEYQICIDAQFNKKCECEDQDHCQEIDPENRDFLNKNKKELKLTLRYMKCRYNNEIRRSYCNRNFGWELPKRLQTYDGPEDYAAQLPASVYWYNEASNGGIENTFMRFAKQEGDDFRGAVVFDLSYQKFKLKEFNSITDGGCGMPSFEHVKTLKDFQNYIVKIQVVGSGEHPSNPWSDDLLNNFPGGQKIAKQCRESCEALAKLAEEDPEYWESIKEKVAARKAVKAAETADADKKQKLRDKIREKRLQRQGLK
jgi:hypothetical protein